MSIKSIKSEAEMEKFSKLAEDYKIKNPPLSSILYATSAAVGTGMEGDLAGHVQKWTALALKSLKEHRNRKDN